MPNEETSTGARVALSSGAALVIISAFVMLPIQDWLMDFVSWIREAGPAGFIAFGLVYIAFTVMAGPASILSLGAGFAWGPLVGWLVVLPSATLGATAAFLLGRTVLRTTVEAQVATRPRFAAIDKAVAKRGFVLVLLMRLSPLFPFNFLNYALGLTQVSLRNYVLATLLGIAPGALLYTWIGSSITQITDLGAGAPTTPNSQALHWGGLVATLAATMVVTRIARDALAASVPTQTQD
jgi:uncharacterized membrane protein YdjX (TVP38/TMEM64 family)